MEQQNSLFNDEHQQLGQLLDRMDQLPEDELGSKWPKSLAELIDVMAAELERQGLDPDRARRMAGKQAGAVAHFLGGRVYYLPTGDKLKDALRDDMIWAEFNGRNLDALASKFRLSQPHLYAILRQQRALHRARHQPDLPFNG